jgi:hypothetical protein
MFIVRYGEEVEMGKKLEKNVMKMKMENEHPRVYFFHFKQNRISEFT